MSEIHIETSSGREIEYGGLRLYSHCISDIKYFYCEIFDKNTRERIPIEYKVSEKLHAKLLEKIRLYLTKPSMFMQAASYYGNGSSIPIIMPKDPLYIKISDLLEEIKAEESNG